MLTETTAMDTGWSARYAFRDLPANGYFTAFLHLKTLLPEMALFYNNYNNVRLRNALDHGQSECMVYERK
jgi:hypothetical protein